MTELARVEIYNVTRNGRAVGTGWWVFRWKDGRRCGMLADFGSDGEAAARAYAAAWRPS